MLTSSETIKVVAEALPRHQVSTIVVDPVCTGLVAESRQYMAYPECVCLGYGINKRLPIVTRFGHC